MLDSPPMKGLVQITRHKSDLITQLILLHKVRNQESLVEAYDEVNGSSIL